eukprot:c9993_g1_i2.p1 GENE.c9993_g1_i2~~c9993_g1_i2.p1  ORF type:complete len:389 (+),score=74.24 c9993_g1_i2:224-1390(+)
MMASAYGFSESELAGCVSLFFVGSGLGSLLGAVSDLYGRKPVLWLSLFVGTTATFSSALSWNFLSYAVCRFCAGVGTGGVLVVSHLFVLEFMVPGSRGLVGVCVSIFFAFSSAAISLVAYLLRRHSWQTLTVVLNCLPLAVLFALPWFDESPRFLLKQGHRNQAAVVLQRVARTNRKSYDCDFFGSVGEELSSGREWTLRRLLYPSLRWKILAMVFCWFSVQLGFYCIAFEAGHLYGDVYTNNALISIVGIPGVAACKFLQESSLGRIGTQIICFGIMGAALIATQFVGEEAKLVLAMVGRFGASSALAMVFTSTAEILPTSVRSTGVGLCNVLSRVGCTLAPIMVSYDYTAALGVCGVFAAVSALLTGSLPETRGKELREVAQEDMR